MRKLHPASIGWDHRGLAWVLLALAPAVSAAADSLVVPISYEDGAAVAFQLSLGQTAAEWESADFPLASFDPALGTLTCWRITLEGGATSEVTAYAVADVPDAPVSAVFSGRTEVAVSLPASGLDLIEIGPILTSSGLCSGFGFCDGGIFESGSASYDSGLLDPALIPPSALGPGGVWHTTIRVLLEATLDEVNGASNVHIEPSTFFAIHGSVTYFYTPEPGVAALVASGLGVLAAGRRRRATRGEMGPR